MTERWELVELIGQTLEERNIAASEQTAEAVLDSVEDLLRADEREYIVGRYWHQREADLRNELRAQVDALGLMSDADWDYARGYEAAKSDVLDLLHGGSDGDT